MRIVTECHSCHGWQLVKVASNSEAGKEYDVLMPPWERTPGEGTCTCRGFEVRGTCSHIKQALRALCEWTSADPDLQQTPRQEREGVCPRCHGRTRNVVYA